MTVRVSRETVIAASTEQIMDQLADVEALVSWSPIHKRVEVLDTSADGRPHHVQATLKVLGQVDKQILEYHWGKDWMVWDAKTTFQQRGQHGECTLKREGLERTRLRLDITIEPSGTIPAFIMRRAAKLFLQRATQRLRERVMAAVGQGPQA
jgi:ribosomal protein L30/L7E